MPDSTAFNDQPYLTRRDFIAGLMAMPAAAAIPGMPTEIPVRYVAPIEISDALIGHWVKWEGVKWVTP